MFQTLPKLLNKNNAQKLNKIINNNKCIENYKTRKAKNKYTSLKQKILNKNDKELNDHIHKFKLCPPFNIDCLIRILTGLCSMNPLQYFDGELNKNNNQLKNKNEIIICLKLILIVMREGGNYFVKIPRVLPLITDNLCYVLLQIINDTKNIEIYQLCLAIYGELLHKLKHKIKLQNEILFKMLFLNKIEYRMDLNLNVIIKEENKQDNNGEEKQDDIFVVIALQHLLDLCNTNWFIKELFLNYDCNLYSNNLCKALVLILSKLSIPGNGILSTSHYLAAQCLLNITNALMQANEDTKEDIAIERTIKPIYMSKNILISFIDIFNTNPEKGILYLFANDFFGENTNINNINIDIIDKIVDILFYCTSISKLQVGNYLGLQDKLNREIRIRYIDKRYSFTSMSFDDAMRLFFEDFILPKETQQIDRILQTFSDKYCADNKCNNDWNLSPSNTYTLCFASTLLHTNQHNKNIKHMTFEQFISLIKHVEDTEHININLLENMYNSMTEKQMRLCHDNHYTLCSWNLLIQKNNNTIYYNVVNDPNDILHVIFDPLLTTFCLLFDVIKENEKQLKQGIIIDKLMNLILTGLYNLSVFISHCNKHDKMDLLILRLCQLTGLHEIGNIKCGLKYSQSFCKKEASHLLLNIIYKFGADIITEEGWNHILLIVMQCARLSLLPYTMYQLDDFVGGKLAGRALNRSFKYLYNVDESLLIRELTAAKQQQEKQIQETQQQTLFGTLVSFLDVFQTPSDDLKEKEKEKQLLNSAQIILTDYCKINMLFKKSSLYSIESLRYLIKSLIKHSDFGLLPLNINNIDIKTHNIDGIIHTIYIDTLSQLPVLQCSCLCIQFLTSVLLHNWQRIEYIWDLIITHFKQLLQITINQNDHMHEKNDKVNKQLYEAMLESIVIGILKICVRGIQLQCTQYTQCIMSSITLISHLFVEIFEKYKNISFQIAAAMNRLIKQICSKKLLYLRHKTSNTTTTSPSSSISSLSSLSSLNSMREHHARRLSDYKWWSVLPWNHIFIIIKLASSKYTTIDISARMFLNILGVFDYHDNDQPFIKDYNINQNIKNKNVFYSKIAFLPNNPFENMHHVIEIFAIFISAKFNANSVTSLKIMIIKAICNVLQEMEYFYDIITNNKNKIQPNNDESGPGDIYHYKDIELKIFKYIRVFIIYIIKLCGSLCSVIRTKALLLLEYILLRSNISKIFINKNIHFIIDMILNVLCSELIMTQLSSLKKIKKNTNTNSFQLITQSRIFAISLLYRYFVQHLNQLNYNNNFKDIWMKILCCTDIMLEMKLDPKYNELYVSIKQNLKNVLRVMIDDNIINENDDDNHKTWNKINDMFPRMKSELFANQFHIHPTPTPYSVRIEEQLKIDEKYIIAKDAVDVSSAPSEEIVLVD